MRPSLLAAVTLCTLMTLACGGGAPDASSEQAERRVENRERLRRELGAKYGEAVPRATPDELIRGARLYQRLCASCHGASGRGDGEMGAMLTEAPGDLTDPARAVFYSPRAKLAIIRDGIPGTPMGPWGKMLREDELLALYHYVESLVETTP